jgi:predicted amidophosphoribosyltransferase
MKCPRCHSENPETKRFCRECGEKLLLACPGLLIDIGHIQEIFLALVWKLLAVRFGEIYQSEDCKR